MYVLRCTRRLLPAVRRHLPPCSSAQVATNRLGDWYANRLNSAQQRYIIVVNEATLLSLLVPARDPAALPVRITAALDALLHSIGIADVTREQELARMHTLCIAGGHDRSAVASMNALTQRAYEELYDLPHRPGRTLDHIGALLAGIPLAKLGYRTPADAAAERLQAIVPYRPA